MSWTTKEYIEGMIGRPLESLKDVPNRYSPSPQDLFAILLFNLVENTGDANDAIRDMCLLQEFVDDVNKVELMDYEDVALLAVKLGDRSHIGGDTLRKFGDKLHAAVAPSNKRGAKPAPLEPVFRKDTDIK